jgi:hypothetical protein
MSWFDDAVNAVKGAVKDVGKAIREAVRTGGTVLGTVISDVGAPLKFVFGGVVHELGDLLGIHMRTLTYAERNVLRGVFHDSLPVNRILVTSIPGKDGRAFTIPGSMVPVLALIVPGIGGLIALGSLIEHLQDKYLMNVGGQQYRALLPSNYDTGWSERAGSLLVHEATHVWQGHHSAWSWWYVFNSLYNQIKCGAHAYDVDEQQLHTWSEYGVEQQAHLVENWYSRGSSPSDVDYPFIRDNIRPGRPKAQTNFPANVSRTGSGVGSRYPVSVKPAGSFQLMAPALAAKPATLFQRGG